MAKIVLLEDNDTVRNLIVWVLQREGHEVSAFPDAAPALEDAGLADNDLAIVDLMMPTSGDAFIQHIRGMGLQTPVIVLSGELREGDEARLKAIGAQQVMKKPFLPTALLGVVKHLLSTD